MAAIVKEIRGTVITAGGDIGTDNNGNTVTGLQGVPISTTPPADGDVLTFVLTDGQWEPKPPTGGSGNLLNSFLFMGG